MARFWLGLALLTAVWADGWTAMPSQAAQIAWCMRVVPSGELVIRYGASWCQVSKPD